METNELLGLGPTVAIVDDQEREINSLREALTERKVGHRFFKVDIGDPKYPENPVSTVQLVFLDLNYSSGFGGSFFDPYICMQWLNKIIPEGHPYSLVIWSKDKEYTSELLKVMRDNGATMPFFVDTKQKDHYRTGDQSYDIDKLLEELNMTVEKRIEIDVQDYFGQIVEIEKNHVLINCLLHENPSAFEVRRFDSKPFVGYIEPEVGKFLQIRVITKPGVKTFEFSEELNDKSKLFIKNDDFEDLGDLTFLQDQ